MKKCTGNLLLKTAKSAFFSQLSVISKKFEDIKGVLGIQLSRGEGLESHQPV
jgi:hypothetical protein